CERPEPGGLELTNDLAVGDAADVDGLGLGPTVDGLRGHGPFAVGREPDSVLDTLPAAQPPEPLAWSFESTHVEAGMALTGAEADHVDARVGESSPSGDRPDLAGLVRPGAVARQRAAVDAAREQHGPSHVVEGDVLAELRAAGDLGGEGIQNGRSK